MSRRVLMGGLALLVLAGTVPAMAAEFTNYGGLGAGEVLISASGKPEMRVDEEARKKIQRWKYTDAAGNVSDQKRQDLIAFIGEERKTTYLTMLNPIFAAGLVTKDQIVRKTFSGDPNGLKIGAEATDDELAEVKAAAGIEEDGKKVKKGSDVYEFKDIEINFWFQNKPSTDSGNRRAEWGASDFDTKYTKVTLTEAEFGLRSPMGNPPYSPPGDVSFDAGVNDDALEQPIEKTNEGPVDYTCEVFVELKGQCLKNGSPYKDFTAEKPVARQTVYVEKYLPRLPENLNAPEIQTTSARLTPKGDSNGNAFVIGMGKYYKNDGSQVTPSGAANAEQKPTELYYWPNTDQIDRDGDGYDDYTWDAIVFKMDPSKDPDKATNMSFNYEQGLSVKQRIKYKDDPNAYGEPGGWKYMYYVPYRVINNEVWGPYAGAVHSAAADMDGWDKYDVDQPGGDAFADYYQPMVFPDTYTFNGVDYKPKALIDKIHSMPDAGVEVQKEYDQLVSDYKFPHIAGISVKWNRECVQGITVGNSANPELKIAPGTMLLGTGFSAAKVAGSGRLGSFEADYDNIATADSPTSLIGTIADGTEARDSFFKINAADCCNNDVVIASGTYGAEDNLKPIPKIVIEEMDSHNKQGQLYLDVATVPNDLTGAGDPVGQYDVDRTYSRLHKSTVPLYGTGVQGDPTGYRGYGNFSNNAATWNGLAVQQTLQNPVDQKGVPFLSMRNNPDASPPEPPFEERRRYQVTITGDDNVGPAVNPEAPPTGGVFWPIRHLSYTFYHHPSATSPDQVDGGARQVFEGDYDTVAANVTQNMEAAGFRVMTQGAIVDVPGYDAPESEWKREPAGTFEYNFPASGLWVARVDCVDRSANGRVMLVPIQVGQVGIKTRSIDMDSRRMD